jgi:hypothetical protein
MVFIRNQILEAKITSRGLFSAETPPRLRLTVTAARGGSPLATTWHLLPCLTLLQDTHMALWTRLREIEPAVAGPAQTVGRLETAGAGDSDLDHLLRTQVVALPLRQRQFYELHYIWGLSEREVVRELGICRASAQWLRRCCLGAIAGAGLARKP